MNNLAIKTCAYDNNSLSSDKALGLALLILWGRRTVLSYIIQLISYVDITNFISKLIIPIIIIILLLPTFRKCLSKIKAIDVLFYLIVLLLGLLSYLNPDNAQALDDSLVYFLFSVFPFFYLGLILHSKLDAVKILNGHSFIDLLYYISILGIIVGWAYQVYLISVGRGTYIQFTQGAVNVLPSVMFCIYIAFKKRKPIYTIIALAGVILLIVLGTRAALFSALAMTCCCLLQKKNRRLIIGAIVLFTLYSIFENVINEYFARAIAPKLISSGLSVRVVDMLLGDSILDSSNRFAVYEKVLSRVIDRPIFGYGLFGDRAFFEISGSYSHNIIIEFLVDFGIGIGTVLTVSLVVIYIKTLKKCAKDACVFGLILSLICAVSVRLILSQSYLMEQDFFLLLGLCIGTLRSKDYNKKEEYE